MADYKSLAKNVQVDPKKEVPFVFDMLEGSPTIWSLPATEENKPFMNESLRRVAARKTRRTKIATADTVSQSRSEDKELLAHFCARRWNVKDGSGKEVEFSAEEAIEFFNAIPDFLFDEYRAYLTDITNWIVAAELGER